MYSFMLRLREAWERKELLNFTFAELDYLIVQVDLFLIEVFYWSRGLKGVVQPNFLKICGLKGKLVPSGNSFYGHLQNTEEAKL